MPARSQSGGSSKVERDGNCNVLYCTVVLIRFRAMILILSFLFRSFCTSFFPYSSELGDKMVDHLYQQTGAPIHSAYALAQLRVLYSDPNLVPLCQSIHRWQTIASVCLSRWTGQNSLPISFSEASWTGLLNHRLCEYEQDVLDLLPDACCQALPELADFDDCDFDDCDDDDDRSVLTRGIAKDSCYWDRWPELRTTRFFLGLGDGACANVGSKCSTPGRIACTVGTSAAARVVLRSPIGSDTGVHLQRGVPPGLFCYRIDRSHVLIGGALTDGGSVVEWVSQLLNLSTEEAFQDCLQKVETLAETDDVTTPGQTGSLTVVPFLSGERSTGFRSQATGAILGLTRETTPAHLFKSCLEGVTLRIAAIVNLIQDTIPGDAAPRIIASGKALEVNALWRQMLADSTGLEVVFDKDTEEGTSRGVACLVSMALAKSQAGATESTAFLVDEPVEASLVSSPRESSKDYWQHAARNQDGFINAISGLFTLT
jgi:gluconokinase